MALDSLIRKLADRFRGKDVLQYLDVPSLVVVNDVEAANRLKRRYSSRQLLVLHGVFEEGYHSFVKLGGEKIEGFMIPGHSLGRALVQIYERNKASAENTQSLAALEEAVASEASRRDENKRYMAQVARSFEGTANSGSQDVLDLIGQILTSQFEHQEHFIRELGQNSAAATYGVDSPRIDIQLDPVNRIIRFEDNGIGMSRETMENVYFNLYKSINEALDHAAGKFGIGAVSIFGLGHEYIMVDSMPRSGIGGKAIVDAHLQRDDFLPSSRFSPGTTIEIKLSPTSTVDFAKVVAILKEDCSYIETPIYVTQSGQTELINKPLNPDIPQTVVFDDGRVSGYVTRADVGELKLLSHRIRLSSVPTHGYEGVVNFDQLDTTFSRDTVMNDPALHYVLEYARDKARRLRRIGTMDLKAASLEARVADYGEFVRKNVFKEDGQQNDEWLITNLTDIVNLSHKPYAYEEQTVSGRMLTKMLDVIDNFYLYLAKKIHRGKDDDWGAYDLRGKLLSGTFLGSVSLAGVSILYGVLTQDVKSLYGMIPLCLVGIPSLPFAAGILAEEAVRNTRKSIDESVARFVTNHYGVELFDDYAPVNQDSSVVKNTVSLSLRTAGLGVGLAVIGSILMIGAGMYSDFSHQAVKRETAKLEETAPVSSQKDWGLAPYAAGAGVLALGVGTSMLRKRRKYERADRQLTDAQQDFIEEIIGELGERSVKIYYGKNLKRDDPRFLVKPDRIVLNGARVFPPWTAALEYAATGVKDYVLAGQIADRNLGRSK